MRTMRRPHLAIAASIMTVAFSSSEAAPPVMLAAAAPALAVASVPHLAVVPALASQQSAGGHVPSQKGASAPSSPMSGFTWSVKALTSHTLGPVGRPGLGVAVGDVAASGAKVSLAQLLKKSTRQTISRGPLILCEPREKDGKKTCGPAVDVPANSSETFWIDGGRRAGQFDRESNHAVAGIAGGARGGTSARAICASERSLARQPPASDIGFEPSELGLRADRDLHCRELHPPHRTERELVRHRNRFHAMPALGIGIAGGHQVAGSQNIFHFNRTRCTAIAAPICLASNPAVVEHLPMGSTS